MSFLNLNLSLLAYADGPASQTPTLRLADLRWSFLGLPTDKVRQVPISLAPGESVTVASTARSLDFDTLTQFTITRANGVMRISGSFGQRTARSSGDNTTQWTLSKSGDIMRAKVTGGTNPAFVLIQSGDVISFDAGFAVPNQGDYVILAKGADYVEFMNPYGVAEVVTAQVKIFSNGPVQKGDVLDLQSAQFAFPNRGTFPITRVTAEFIEVVNPNAFEETVSGVTTGYSIYPYTYKWLACFVDRRVLMGLNGYDPGSIEIEPMVEGDLAKNPGPFLKRGKVFEVQVYNPGLTQAEGILLLAE